MKFKMKEQQNLASDNPVIVRKVSVIDTLRAIKPGNSATYRSRDLGLYSSACSAVCRLNSSCPGSYSIVTDDNGESYTVTHNK